MHTILSIDPHGTLQAALGRAIAASPSPYPFAITRHPPAPSEGLAGQDLSTGLRSLLNLSPDIPDALHEPLLSLRAVLLDWDALEAAADCCRLIRERRPQVALIPVFRARDLPPAAQPILAWPWVYPCVGEGWEHDLEQVIWVWLKAQLDEVYRAPYWDALQAFGANPPANFHALPIGAASSFSDSIQDFTEALGRDYLATETSLAIAPLDSLLNPTGPLRQAQHQAAVAFGVRDPRTASDQCRGTLFLTTGTSAANRVVITAFARPDDYVLLDRGCHISHHSALACCYTRPILLRPFCNAHGITGPVSLETLGHGLWFLLTQKHCLPALIILTNPTFDGFLYRPQRVFSTLVEVLRDYWRRYGGSASVHALWTSIARFQPLSQGGRASAKTPPPGDEATFVATALRAMVLLFDEAWSSHGIFHPRLVDFSAMHAVANLEKEAAPLYPECWRVYCTQSTHKTLSALRQGSMIHYRDPLLAAIEHRDALSEAYRAHSTTSPNSNILASIDVARRQAQWEGTRLIDRALSVAEAFRRDFTPETQDGAAGGFFALSIEAMMRSHDPSLPDLSPQDFELAPNHVSISWSMGANGSQIQRLLLQQGIQINKIDSRSVLAIFNIGVTQAALLRLREALRRIESGLMTQQPRDKAPLWRPPPWAELEEVAGNRNLGYWFKNLGGYPRSLIDIDELLARGMPSGTEDLGLVAGIFVTPYPPGYPLLIPGQVVRPEHIKILSNLRYGSLQGVKCEANHLRISVLEV